MLQPVNICVALATAFILAVPPGRAQPPQDDDLRELIVLLAPEERGAPSALEVIGAVNRGEVVPGNLGLGSPDRARLAIPRRPTGRLADYVARNVDSAEARGFRYVVLHFPDASLEGILAAILANKNVEFAEVNKRLRLHSAAPPKAAELPSDPLLGTGASDPAGFQWGLHLLRFPEAWTVMGPGRGKVAVLDTGIQVSHPEFALFGTDSTGELMIGPQRVQNDRDLLFGNCGVDELDPEDGVVRFRAGHGSHVASTIAAATNNGIGIASGSWMAGTDPSKPDTDCDGVSDGDEVLVYDTALSDYGDPRVGPCGSNGLLFADAFESGDLSAWSGSGP